MTAGTTKLNIRLPAQDVVFAKQYARDHGITVTEVIDRYLRQMRELEGYRPGASLDPIIGLVPPEVDAESEILEHRLDKHQS